MKKLSSNRGETLLEVVLSIGVFSITLLMLASMFFAAQNNVKKNYDTEVLTETVVNAAVTKNGLTKASSSDVIFALDDGTSVTQNIALMQTNISGAMKLYQFQIN